MKNSLSDRRTHRYGLGLSIWLGIVSSGFAYAQMPTWRVTAGAGATVTTPDLPAATRSFSDSIISEAGGSRLGMRLTAPTSAEGYWAFQGNRWIRYTQLGVATTLGPGRSGAESNHVFLSVDNGWGGSAIDGERVFAARASDPVQTQFASYGLWRFDGVRNIEIARGSNDGLLGPGLGAGWVFKNTLNFPDARMLPGGQAIIIAEVVSPAAAESRIVARHVPGVGNLPCMRTGTSEVQLAPGLNVGDEFQNFTSSADRFLIAPGGKVRARLSTSTSRVALFELCDGPPRALIVNNETGIRGPQLGISGAEFRDFSFGPMMASDSNDFYFLADWRVPPAASRTALFRRQGGQNVGIAYNEASGFYGPNWIGSTWSSFDSNMLSVAGSRAAFTASALTPENTSVRGLWRVQPGTRPELLALIGLTGSFAPEPGRTWRTFDAVAVFSNGDVVLEATTNPGIVDELWLFKVGQAPQRILSEGQSVNVPTTTGIQSAVVSSFDVNDGASRNAMGDDDWAGADGTLLVRANSNVFGSLLLTTKLDVPDPDVLLRSGFE